MFSVSRSSSPYLAPSEGLPDVPAGMWNSLLIEPKFCPTSTPRFRDPKEIEAGSAIKNHHDTYAEEQISSRGRQAECRYAI